MSDINLKVGLEPDYKKLDKDLKKLDSKDAKIDIDLDTTKAESTLQQLKGKLLDGLAIGSGIAVAEQAIGGLINAGKEAFNSFKNFDSAVQNIATLDAVDNISGLRDVLNEVSKTTVDDASVLANATYQALSAGIKGSNEELGAFAATASKVATAGGSDAETAVDALTTVMNSFKIETADAGKVSDQIFATIKAGKTSFGELSSSLSNVTGAASSAGLQFGEVAASIATLTAQGIPTAQATTQIRSAIIALQKPNADTKKLFAEMGLTVSDVAERLKAPIEEGGGLTNVLNDLGDKAAENGKSFTQLFSSVEAGSAALALTGENSAKAFENLGAVLNDSAGSAEFAYQQASASIENQLGLIGGTIQALFNDLFITIQPLLQGILQAVSTGLDGIAFVAGNLSDILTTLAPLMLGIGTALVITNAETIKNIALTKSKIIIDKAVALATKGWAVAQRALNLVLNANPIGLVITAIGLLVTGVKLAYDNSETFRKALDVLYENTLKPLVDGFLGLAKSVGAFLGLIDEDSDKIDKNTKSIDDNNKAKDENNKKTDEQNDKLEDQKSTLDSLSASIENYKKGIQEAVESGDLETAKKLSMELKSTQAEYDKLKATIDSYIPSQQKANKEQKEAVKTQKELVVTQEDFLKAIIATTRALSQESQINTDAFKGIQEDIKEAADGLPDIIGSGLSNADLFEIDLEVDGDKFLKEFEKAEQAKRQIEDLRKSTSELIGEIAGFDGEALDEAFKGIINNQDTLGNITNINKDNYEEFGEVTSNVLGNLANATEENTALNKTLSATQVIVNTAVAITKALAQGGIFGIAQAGIIGALGALQLQTVLGADAGERSVGSGQGKKPSSRDVYPYLLRKDEAVTTPEMMAVGNNNIIMDMIHAGLDVEKELLKADKFSKQFKPIEVKSYKSNSYDFTRLETKFDRLEKAVKSTKLVDSNVKIDLMDRPQKNTRSIFTRRVSG